MKKKKQVEHTASGSRLVLCRRDSGESMCVWDESDSSGRFFLGILKRDAMLKNQRRQIDLKSTKEKNVFLEIKLLSIHFYWQIF